MPRFKQFVLRVPPLDEKAWDKEAAAAKGIEKQLLILQSKAARLLQGINDFNASPERVAWLSMWTKAFAALDGGRIALIGRSEYLLNIISRIIFEGTLHGETILEPAAPLLKNWSPQKKTLLAKAEDSDLLIQRLRAYTAWCLWNDQLFYKELQSYRTLDGVWNPEPALQMASDKNKLTALEEILGLDNAAVNKWELKKGRSRIKKHLQEKLKIIEDLLADPLIAEWQKKLQRTQEIGTLPFFALFAESDRSVLKHLKGMDLRFAYPIYMQGSMLIHGSTIDQLLHIEENKISPIVASTERACELAAFSIHNSCDYILILLDFLQNFLWPMKHN